MDFFRIATKKQRSGTTEIFPDWLVVRSKDLMVRGGSFYAIWDEEKRLWSTDEYDVQRLVDEELRKHDKELPDTTVRWLYTFDSNSWAKFKQYVKTIGENAKPLDSKLTFADQVVKKTDYVSKKLPYSLAHGDHSAWDKIVGTLYSASERAKIEWAIGAVLSGDSTKIQKFLVLYGPAGTGKSTILNIVEKLFVGYTTSFEAKALGSSNSAFATEVFKDNPLVAIQHDGDLSKIDDNTRLNSIVAHEKMTMNEKYKASYTNAVNAFLFMGTNQPVKITDAKSGIIRRLIDVTPTGARLDPNQYNILMAQIDFELGAIAAHCLDVYRKMGKNYYNTYRPLEMMLQTDIFYNFIESAYDLFKSQDGTTLRQAYALYKDFCADTGIEKPAPQYKVREELRNYFDEFHDRKRVGEENLRSVYSGFNANKFKQPSANSTFFSLVLEEKTSLLDELLEDSPAQAANSKDLPSKPWDAVTTTLKDLDTRKTHFVKVPENHIVIDFDLKDESGEKSLEKNLEAASYWPPTYGELSKSGSGVHLHYIFTGDVSRLEPNFSEGIEVKHYPGGASLRRKLTLCNSVPIAEISSGLPIKEERVIDVKVMQNEQSIRTLITRNLRKEIHPGTKPSVDFIAKILEDAYESGMPYDVTDMRSSIMAFASSSTNQSLACLKIVQKMKFASEPQEVERTGTDADDSRITFYDCEVFPNLFVVSWKYEGTDEVVSLVNPTPQEIEKLVSHRLVGFYCRRYDNHILYARMLGYTNEALFQLSQKIIVDNNRNAFFGEAYDLSYTDIWDYCSKKQSLKKWEIELGIHHMEIDIPWDQPVPDADIPRVVSYCENDVRATEAVHKARRDDWFARQILAKLAGGTVNESTQQLTRKIIFGRDKSPRDSFVYTDLSKMFPGYVYDKGVSTYRGETIGEGGYVYAEPGYYQNVALLDVASMHPASIEALNLFGTEYTGKFADLKRARLAIKHKDWDTARTIMNGAFAPFINEEDSAGLAYALKIAINIVYGLTYASFDTPFRDPRNKDNIVAKRGALFMVDLKNFVQEQGFTVAHIKTDSIKIPNATQEIIDKVFEFGRQYGYEFEHEATYDKFCLLNDAVYVARKDGKWSATGAQFAHPYVFKKLFSGEHVSFSDLCESRSVVKGAMYLDFDAVHKPMFEPQTRRFVGRTGRFIPVTQESGGGLLLRVHDGKAYAVTGTKGYFWIEAELGMSKTKEATIEIDMSYFENLLDEAVKNIQRFVSVKELLA